MENLPVILLSAANDDFAAEIISELVDNDVTGEYAEDAEPTNRVWRLINKYYKADVRVRTLTDDRQLQLNLETIEAHVIYITEEELQDGEVYANSRVSRSCGAWSREGVERIVLAECASAPHGLVAWCETVPRSLLVPRTEQAVAAEPGPFVESFGLQRLRDALHAHMWPNLQRTDAEFSDTINLLNGADECGSDEDEWGSDVEWQSADSSAAGQARLFAAVLHAASALRAAPPAPPGVAPDAARRERLDRAEGVLRALCRDLSP